MRDHYFRKIYKYSTGSFIYTEKCLYSADLDYIQKYNTSALYTLIDLQRIIFSSFLKEQQILTALINVHTKPIWH